MTFRRFLLFLLLIGPFFAGTSARAQAPPPITLEAQAGYDGAGTYRANFWFPVAITVTNTGGDSVGVLSWAVPGDAASSFEYVLDLPRGARKRVVLPVVNAGFNNRARLTLRIDGEQVAQTLIRLNQIGMERPTLAVISSDATALNSLQAARFTPDANTAVVRLAPDLLPDDAALLAGLDAIF
ncbi:MAG: hypothetical protein ACPL8I_03700, partial [Chloroflexaceae bacterium]